MTKIILIIAVIVALSLGGYYYFTNQSKISSSPTTTLISAPTRPAEINGIITSALGNELKIAKEIGKIILSEADQAAKKAEMQKLSPEARSAAKAEESANLETEDVVLTIPVGIPISKGSGDGSGKVISADIAELIKGVYVSIWTDQTGKVEYVKIKGI